MSNQPMIKVRLPFAWERFLIYWCATFHGLMALIFAVAPVDQIHNAGTDPVFRLASRNVWSLVFALCAAGSVLLLQRYHPAAQIATWVLVFSCSAVWFTAFFLAVLQHRGSAISIIVWPFLYGPWIVAAFRVGLGKR